MELEKFNDFQKQVYHLMIEYYPKLEKLFETGSQRGIAISLTNGSDKEHRLYLEILRDEIFVRCADDHYQLDLNEGDSTAKDVFDRVSSEFIEPLLKKRQQAE